MLTTLLLLLGRATAQQPMPAVDCGHATTPVERAICADPGVASANSAMSFAFAGLRAELPADQQAALLVDQQSWTQAREASCGDKSGTALVRCLVAETRARERMLAGGGRNRDLGAPPMRPAFFHEARRGYDIEIAYPQIPSLGAGGGASFNKTAREAILGDAALMGQYRAEGAGQAVHDVSYDIHYLGRRMATIVYWLVSRNRGWAHPFTARETLVFDLVAGRPMHPDDLLESPPQAVAPLSSLCKRRLEMDAGAEGWRLLPNANTEAVVANFQNWAPGPFALDILFDAGTIAPEAAGMHECRLDYPMLALSLKLKLPLPPR